MKRKKYKKINGAKSSLFDNTNATHANMRNKILARKLTRYSMAYSNEILA